MRYFFGVLPFVGSTFWKVLLVVAVLVILTWYLLVRLAEYEMTKADYGGSFICSIIFSYWIHLWLLPIEQVEYDDEDEFGPDGNETREG